ncbi:Signal transduction response regulator, receiver region domain protein [Rhodopirellula maiorica SM1]|uniref:Signal transduction response regulator, receiver region domain protein n=1 Tax=Rhodopirellula maiorica SM1 TaxID=1265738 RepID=M5RNK4_9BACT|nr:TIR domain-containing protein [Rhodopirellula maiorica]EMI20875.1 Signal transduction response regulator, receiver region domain protein [Rhodopirellula maiorica SM1]
MIRAILVEDERPFAVKCVEVMEKCGLSVQYLPGADEARTHLLETTVDVAVIDLMMPPSYKDEGVGLLQWAKQRFPKMEAVLITKKQDQTTEVVAAAMRLGARYFLDKEAGTFFSKLEYHLKEILVEQASNVFISHGHNELLKLKLKDFVQNRYGKTPVILSELPSEGLTIVEKLEKASKSCKCAIILMTKDDQTHDGGVRARQNVIHEIGFFQGKYGRKKVMLLAEKGVEMFSNISGIVRIEFDADHFESVFEPLRIELDATLR